MKFLKIAILLLAIPFTVLFAQIDYAAEAEAIDKIFTDVIKLYKDGNNTEARQLTQQAVRRHQKGDQGRKAGGGDIIHDG